MLGSALINIFLRRIVYKINGIVNRLTVIDGTIIITVGGAIAYEAITTGGVVLTVGSTIIPVAGYTASQWESAVDYAINNIDANRANNHIMQVKHAWNLLVENPTWLKVYPYVEKVLLYGENVIEASNKYRAYKHLVIDGYEIRVFYRIVKGVLTITDAYIQTK